jgi:hypothetical protein
MGDWLEWLGILVYILYLVSSKSVVRNPGDYSILMELH